MAVQTDLLSIRVDLESDLATQLSFLKDYFGIRANTDMIRYLIKDKHRTVVPKSKQTAGTSKKLTPEEEEKLYSWATNTNLKGAEEFDIQRMLQENQHIKDWTGILKKLPDAVAYVLELKKN